jgi:hypothetical protein
MHCLLWLAALQWVVLVVSATSSSTTTHRFASLSNPSLRKKHNNNHRGSLLWAVPRGGETVATEEENEEEEIDNDITQHPEFASLQSYRMQQQILLQLRATFLSEALANRGLPIPTLVDVATPDGAQPPQTVDWDCAMATEKDPKSCLFSFDAELNTKVIAPLGTTQWISLWALNRLRRTDPTKVEPMWYSNYAVLQSWFHPESEYSLLQHVGIQGFLLNALLQGMRLRITLAITMCVAAIVCMPLLEYFLNRFLVSGFVWGRWHQWCRFLHAALPLKLLLGQMAFKFVLSLFDKLLGIVKERLVELECQILEQHIPLTVGVPTIQENDEEKEDDFDWGGDEDEDAEDDSDEA